VRIGDTKIFDTTPYRLLRMGIPKTEAVVTAKRHSRTGDWVKVEKVSSGNYNVWISPPIGVTVPPTYDTEKDLD
jgi:hypothetical protein